MVILHFDPVFLQIVDDPAGYHHLASPSSDIIDSSDQRARSDFLFQLRHRLFPDCLFIFPLTADDTNVLILFHQRI